MNLFHVPIWSLKSPVWLRCSGDNHTMPAGNIHIAEMTSDHKRGRVTMWRTGVEHIREGWTKGAVSGTIRDWFGRAGAFSSRPKCPFGWFCQQRKESIWLDIGVKAGTGVTGARPWTGRSHGMDQGAKAGRREGQGW